MNNLTLPDFPARITEKNGKTFIFDKVRKKHVSLTPEEWVRQHFVNYLITEKHYPSKRCDTIIFNAEQRPFIIVEYKAPHVEITEEVFRQILRYNMSLHARYLIVSNGIRHICCQIDYEKQTYAFLKDIPTFSDAIK